MSVFVVPIEFRAIVYFVCLAIACDLGDLSSPTRDQTWALSSKSMEY